MRILLLVLLTSLLQFANAQKIDKESVYPVFQDIKVKWPKDGYSLPKTSFDECVTGDCNEAEGSRLTLTDLKYEEYGYYLYFRFLKGKFSNAGKNFVGDVYKSRVRYTCDDRKTMKPAGSYDLTNAAFLSQSFIGNGAYYNNGNLSGWHGDAMPVAFAKKFPGATVRSASFDSRDLQWLDIDLPAGSRITRYTGRTMLTGDFLSGKAMLANGDSYEGFFLKRTFFGPGKLTKKNGKVLQGIWQKDSLILETPVELSAFLFEKKLPAKATTTYNFKLEMDGDIQTHRDFHGAAVVNDVADGWGLVSCYWGTGQFSTQGWAYGLFKNNKLDGPGILVTAPAAYDVFFSPGALKENFSLTSGMFKDGKLSFGSRLYGNFDTYPNKELNENDILKMELKDIVLQTGSFNNNKTMQGCGALLKSYNYEDDGKLFLGKLTEGFFTDGAIDGFYFEDDFAHARSLEKLKFREPYRLAEKDVQLAEASNNFCADVMRSLKPQYIAAMKKKLSKDLAAVEEAKKPPPAFNPYAQLQPETTFEATEADYAKVDWDAIGEKRARAGTATKQSIQFWETVSADVRKYLNQTYTANGSTYKRYSRCRYFSPKDFREGSHQINVTGKKTSFLILHFCERTGSDAKANVVIQYEGKKVEGNQFVSGGKCELITQCSSGNICKTECPGAFEFDQYKNTFYGLFMNHTGNWSGAREYWIVLKDEANTTYK